MVTLPILLIFLLRLILISWLFCLIVDPIPFFSLYLKSTIGEATLCLCFAFLLCQLENSQWLYKTPKQSQEGNQEECKLRMSALGLLIKVAHCNCTKDYNFNHNKPLFHRNKGSFTMCIILKWCHKWRIHDIIFSLVVYLILIVSYKDSWSGDKLYGAHKHAHTYKW